MFAISATGSLELGFGRLPAFDDSDEDPDNEYEVEVDATSGEGAREMSATQDITVTVTASGNLVVTLEVDPEEISENGGEKHRNRVAQPCGGEFLLRDRGSQTATMSSLEQQHEAVHRRGR